MTKLGRLLTTLLLAAAGYGNALALDCRAYQFRPADPSAGNEAYLALGGQGLLVRAYLGSAPASYLFGTFHANSAAVIDAWSRLQLLLAAAQPRLLITERDLTQAVNTRWQTLPDQRRLEPLLAPIPGLYSALVEQFAQYRLAPPERLRPWFAGAVLSQAPAVDQAASDLPIVDQLLAEAAPRLGITHRALETFAAIADYYETHFSLTEQVRLLAEAVCNQTLLANAIAAQSRAVAADDRAALYRHMQAFNGSSEALAAKLIDVFVHRRNAAFWAALEPQLRRGGVFIAVGSLHVFGQSGLLQRLLEQGARLQAVPLASLRVAYRPLEQASEIVAWVSAWLAERGVDRRAAGFAELQVEHQSLPVLRRRLCPGRRCRVEASYRAAEKTVLINDALLAPLLAGAAAPGYAYAASVLVRELVRHGVLNAKSEALGRYFSGANAERCLNNYLLHQGSLAQQAFLRDHHGASGETTAKAKFFALDPRCASVEEAY